MPEGGPTDQGRGWERTRGGLAWQAFQGELALVRKAVIAGNWKMHMTCAETRAFARAFLPLIENLPEDREVVLAPPFTAISTLHEEVKGSRVALAGQNVHWEEKGAYTEIGRAHV